MIDTKISSSKEPNDNEIEQKMFKQFSLVLLTIYTFVSMAQILFGIITLDKCNHDEVCMSIWLILFGSIGVGCFVVLPIWPCLKNKIT